jgi:predicted MFS family arabinose efflux permease
VSTVLTLAGAAYVARIVLANVSGPISEAFSMEILDPAERGTMVGLRSAVGQTVSGIGSFLGARLMAGGDFVTPFALMATLYAVSAIAFWVWFRPLEEAPARLPSAVAAAD